MSDPKNAPLGANSAKRAPVGASQHQTAGPYSPVLEIDAAKLVVISGQAPLDITGRVIGDTIEQQAKVTLENCRRQLESAHCTFADVFKVNVYLGDLDEWARFNAVYEEIIPQPRPVRTAIGCALLQGFKVEIEMWAVKSS